MTEELRGCRIAFLAADAVEQVELERPLEAVRQAGGEAELLSLEKGTIQAFKHLDRGDRFPVDRAVADADPDDYDALVVPGGVANPDLMRTDRGAVRFVHAVVSSGKPVAAICHGPWMLVEADVVRERRLTSWPSLKTDIENAGGRWVDEEVVVDGNLITSRRPDDLPAFCQTLVGEFSRNRPARAPGQSSEFGRHRA
jgi:deglycase